MTSHTPVAINDAQTEGRAAASEVRIGRVLIGMTYVAVALLVVGVLLMVAAGISPLSGGPPLDLSTLPSQLRALDPAAFLWAGLLAVVAAPIARVTIAGLAYARQSDWLMVAVSVGILVIIAVGVGTALTVTV